MLGPASRTKILTLLPVSTLSGLSRYWLATPLKTTKSGAGAAAAAGAGEGGAGQMARRPHEPGGGDAGRSLPERAGRALVASAMLAGIDTGRYDLSAGPLLSTKAREERYDILTWMLSKPAFPPCWMGVCWMTRSLLCETEQTVLTAGRVASGVYLGAQRVHLGICSGAHLLTRKCM